MCAEATPKGSAWRQLLRQGVRSEMAFFAGIAILVGLVTALGAYLFHEGIENGLIGKASRAVLRLVTGQEWIIPARGATATWWGILLVLLLPALGLVLAAGLVRFFSGGEHGHGVAGVMEAVALRGGRLRVRPALGRVLAAVVTIATGGSVGPEDPNVQIGSMIGSWLGQRLRLTDERVQTLVACGAAGGIAAAFNAPIAGVFFAQEIILGEFTTAAFGMIVLSAVTSSVVNRALRGEFPAFVIPQYALHSPWELLLYLGLGVLAAGVSVLYVQALLRIEDFSQHVRVHWLIKAALAGLAVGAVGLAFPHLFGVGYETMSGLLQGEKLALGLLLALMLLKPLLTATTLAGGGSGGVFAPSLFIGSMLGGAFGLVANRLFPGAVAPAPAYALVGMGAVLAGAVHCPITAVLLLFELTQDYRIILPVMLCVAVSTLISQRLSPNSVYTERLTRRGIHLHLGRDLNVMEMIAVEEAMTRELQTVPLGMTIEELGRVLAKGTARAFPVVDAQNQLAGIVTLSDYRRALEEGRATTVAEIYARNLAVAYPDQTLSSAMRTLATVGVGQLPVVSRESPTQLLGLLRRGDAIQAYNRGLTRRMELERQVQQMRLASYRGGRLMTIELPLEAVAVGRWIRDLRLPPGTIIATIQREQQSIVPRGETMLQAGDRLVLMVDRPETGDQVRDLLLRGKGIPRGGQETRYNEYVLPPGAPVVGRRIADLQLPQQSLLVNVQRGGRTLVAHGNTVLQEGDRVVVFAVEEDLPLVEQRLLGSELPVGPRYALQQLLVVLDGSATGWRAWDQARELATQLNGALHILLALDGEEPAPSSPEEPAAPAGEEGRVLAELQRRCTQEPVHSCQVVRRKRLLETFDRPDLVADLIVLPHPGEHLEASLSILEWLIRRTGRPVLVAPPHPRPLDRLLVAYDGGPAARQALHLTAQLALALRLAVDVVSVEEHGEGVEALLDQAGAILGRYAVEAEYLPRRGVTSDEIVATAQERQSDMILVGIYRHRYLHRALLGCTLDNLLRKSSLPLLVCSPQEPPRQERKPEAR